MYISYVLTKQVVAARKSQIMQTDIAVWHKKKSQTEREARNKWKISKIVKFVGVDGDVYDRP